MDWVDQQITNLAWATLVKGNYSVIDSLLEFLYPILKTIIHFWYGKCTICRLARKNDLFGVLVQLLASKQLKDILNSNVDYSTKLEAIVGTKRVTNTSNHECVKNAIILYNGLDQIHSSCKEKSESKPTWENSKNQLIESFDSVLDVKHEKYYASEKNGSRNWVALGFQGSNPVTDFRSTGQFGLDCLHSICINHPSRFKTLLVECGSIDTDLKKPWYSAALVSIYFSQYILNMPQGELNYKISTISEKEGYKSLFDALYEIHSRFVFDFHQFWLHQVSEGVVKSVLDAESCLQGFKAKC